MARHVMEADHLSSFMAAVVSHGVDDTVAAEFDGEKLPDRESHCQVQHGDDAYT